MKLYEDVESLFSDLSKLSDRFLREEWRDFVQDRIIASARVWIYNPAKFFPSMYVWRKRFVNPDFYHTEFEKGIGMTASTYSSSSYTYSKHPYVNSIVNGEPYDFGFKYNGVPRPFVEDAQRSITSQHGRTKAEIVKYFKSYGFEAY